MRLSCNDFKIWKRVEDNCKLYVFTCFFIVIIVVNIWISLFIRLYNLCFSRNTLRKITGTATVFVLPSSLIDLALLLWIFFLVIGNIYIFFLVLENQWLGWFVGFNGGGLGWVLALMVVDWGWFLVDWLLGWFVGFKGGGLWVW